MMKRIAGSQLLVIALSLFPLAAVHPCLGQRLEQQQVEEVRSDGGVPKPEPKISAADKQRARQMLDICEAEARGFEAPMRSYSLLQIAQAYLPLDQTKPKNLLRNAFTASLDIHDDDRTKSRLQEEIFRALLPISQSDVEELLPQAQSSARKQASEAIIGRYTSSKQFEKAIDLVGQVGSRDEFPYGSGTQLMMAMPEEMSAERRTLFAQAVSSYQKHEHKGTMIGKGSITDMVVRFGAKMPPRLVTEAIDEILSQAKKADRPASITVGGQAGTASFTSNYEYQLFALLPLLRQLDESRAKALLQDNPALKAQGEKYPNGMQSLDPTLTEAQAQAGRERKSGLSTNISEYPTATANMAEQHIRQEWERKAEEIVNDSRTNPLQAMAQAMSLPATLGKQWGSPRARALEQIARINVKKHSGAAKQSLDQLRKTIADFPLQNQVEYLATVAGLYLQMGEEDTAEKVVKEGFKVADKILEKDKNAEDPNQALKAWWPSVDAYRRFIEVETRISQPAAAEVLKEIKDPEIQTVERIMVSRTLLGTPMKQFMIAEKRGNRDSERSGTVEDN